MLVGRKRSRNSFGPDGRRLQQQQHQGPPRRTSSCVPAPGKSSNRLFQPGVKLVVQRAPVLSGLSIPTGLHRKFRRPMIKRRAYNSNADEALKRSSLGPKRRMDGMAKLLARAGRGLTYKLPKRDEDTDAASTGEESGDDDDDIEKENERPFEPLLLWTSPHQGGEPMGLPPRMATEMQADEYGVEEAVTVLKPAPIEAYAKQNVFVPPVLAKWLRPHQREGVQFMYECVMGFKNFDGQGCILADDMGLGKTLQSVTLIYTLLKTTITANGEPTAKRVIVVCPCSLVKNWENEFVKWLGPGGVKTMALAESDRKTVEKNLDVFVRTRMFNTLIVSYETLRTHVARISKCKDCCDLLVCDEAHRLKNNENQTSRALNSLPVKRRVLLTGTPMQNDLQEFFAMVDFINPGVLGTQDEFRKNMLFPILRGREPDATDSQKNKMMQIQQDMSATVNEFILRRINTLNAQHLPPKLVQVVCCNLTDIQQSMYQHLITHKDMQHVLQGKQANCLGSIQMLMKLCNHPRLVVDDDGSSARAGRRAASKNVKYTDGEEKAVETPGATDLERFLPRDSSGGGRNAPARPEWSGKMFVLYRLMKEMRRPGNGNDKIVIVSNYTQTLDHIGRMCRENSWGFCRLDGSISMKKRQKMVDEFNDPCSSLVAFLLSSKAGGCGLNLIGANRLVLFDPDWNPAVDKQAAARCWRDGQKKRCFTYRFLATGTVEEKIFQRQLSKEGLQSVVDDKEQVNALSTKDLRNLFKLRTGTPSDTHDKLRCERCKIIADNAEIEAAKVLPKKLAACKELLSRLEKHEHAAIFLKPLNPQDHGVAQAEFEKRVRQPIDLATIRGKIELPADQPAAYKNVSGFSKDVSRIFTNVEKVWNTGDDIFDAAKELEEWWTNEWSELVPVLMGMKADDEEEKKEATRDVTDAINERGENFQEQIGMPDEEDMRSWSHHYSTDTVDDPIFRSAMKGCEAVSFVFGLEVTWSLIQQRQQEEEERQEMKELEAIQELENMQAESLDDGDDVKMEEVEAEAESSGDDVKVEEKVGETRPTSDSSDEETVDEEESGCGVKAKPNQKAGAALESESDSSETESIQERPSSAKPFQSPDLSASTESSRSAAKRSPDETQTSQETDPEVSQSPSQTQSEEDQSQRSVTASDPDQELPNGMWACVGCTLHNKKSAKKCSVCGTKRPPKAKRRRVTIDDDSE